MGFFRRYQGRGSYDLFSNYSHYLPGVGGMFMLFFLFLVGSLLGQLMLLLMQSVSSEFAEIYGVVITYPVMFIPPMLYASAMSRRNEFAPWGADGSEPASIALDRNDFGRLGGLRLALITTLATIATAFVVEPINAMLPEMPEVLKQVLEGLTNGPLWISLLSVSIFAPFFEEWLCRGIVLRGLLQKMNPFVAITISAAFFAILHMNPWQAIPAFVLGLLFGYVYYKTGSLKLTMLMHCANNTMAVIISNIPSLAEAETMKDVMSSWAYVCVYIACIIIIAASLVVFKGIRR